MILRQAAELQQGGRVAHPLAAEVDARKPTQRHAVEQRAFASHIGQVETVLHEVHLLQPQHGQSQKRRNKARELSRLGAKTEAEADPF